jgi:hypothetical protein
MTNYLEKNVLKGLNNIARGNAPGLVLNRKIVRVLTFFKKYFLFRTKKMGASFLEKYDMQFRPEEVYYFDFLFLANGFNSVNSTQGVALG